MILCEPGGSPADHVPSESEVSKYGVFRVSMPYTPPKLTYKWRGLQKRLLSSMHIGPSRSFHVDLGEGKARTSSCEVFGPKDHIL